MAWIANGQVVRSSQQQAQANALRVRLWNCLDAGPGALVDRCRAQVMASIAQDGNAPAAALPVPASLALWSSEAGAATELPRSAVLPVSMVQGLR
jgi:hypothetical protein